ncbi:unnamed protein product, partial [Brenthis ino]
MRIIHYGGTCACDILWNGNTLESLGVSKRKIIRSTTMFAPNNANTPARAALVLWHNKSRLILINATSSRVAGGEGPVRARAPGTRPTAARRSLYLVSGVHATSANPPATSAARTRALDLT